MLVWAGDFNYRVEASYEEALARIEQNELEWLLEKARFCKLCNYTCLSYASLLLDAESPWIGSFELLSNSCLVTCISKAGTV